MDKFGCFYNPRPAPGRCIKDPKSTSVDGQCEIVDDKCTLKVDKSKVIQSGITQPQVTQSGITQPGITKPLVVPTRAALEKYGPTANVKDMPDIPNAKLSGPVTAYSGIYNNNKYLFFGDAHFSFKGTCAPPCKSVTQDFIKTDNNSNCWEIARLLVDIFDKAEADGTTVDFYIEMPFLPKGKFIPSRDDIEKASRQTGFLYALYYMFYDCFNKSRCKWKNVRFHYVDVRLQYKSVNFPELVVDMDILDRPERLPFTISDVTFEGQVINRIGESIQILGMKLIRDNRNKDKFIDTTNSLIKDLYYSGGQTMSGMAESLNIKLFRLYLTSDNFREDARNLAKDMIAKYGTDYDVLSKLVDDDLLVIRRGKTMHRARAQVEALEQENPKMAEQIKEYVINKYIQNVDNTSLMNLWNKFMTTYNNFILAKSRTMGDNRIALEKLMKEFREIQEIMTLGVSSTALLMDAYLLARMFRTFPGTNHQVSTTNIVYAGAAHINHYQEFFNKVLGTSFYRYGPSNLDEIRLKANRCLDININNFL